MPVEEFETRIGYTREKSEEILRAISGLLKLMM
jgi:hypothetical protein